MPYIPNDAPFNNDQRSWISGFIAGLESQRFLDGSKDNQEISKNERENKNEPNLN